MAAKTNNGKGTGDTDVAKARYGFWVVILGIVALVAVLIVVLQYFRVATDVAAVLGPVTTAIAGLAGAFFGINLGQAGAAKSEEKASDAEKEKDKAQQRAEAYAAALDPNVAQGIRQSMT